MFNLFKKKSKALDITKKITESKPKLKSKVGGYVEYFGIEDFWLNKLTDVERKEIKEDYSKGLNTDPDSIDNTEILSTSMKLPYFLNMISRGISNDDIALYIIDWATEEVEKTDNISDKHFSYMSSWKKLKLMVRENESYYPKFIELLQKDCDIHDEFNVTYRKEWGDIPNYPAFKELALAYERTRDFQKAIDISKLALKLKVKETTSFERRIEKLQKKV